jgi:hypothetical protein
MRLAIMDCRDRIAEARQYINRWRNNPEASVVDDHEARFILEKLSEATKQLATLERRLNLVTDETLQTTVNP